MALNNTECKSQRTKETLSLGELPSGDIARRVYIQQEGDPIPVEIVEDGFQGVAKNIYDEVSALASGSLTTVVTYTVPAGKSFYLKEISGSGENRALFSVEVNGSTQEKQRTYNSVFNVRFLFYNYKLSEGDVVRLRVIHARPFTGDFEGAIKGSEA